MRSTTKIKSDGRLKDYVVSFANGLFYFNVFMLLQIVSAYILAYGSESAAIWFFYTLGGFIAFVFILLLPFIFFLPFAVYIFKCLRTDRALGEGFLFVLTMTVFTLGLIVWFAAVPSFKLV